MVPVCFTNDERELFELGRGMTGTERVELIARLAAEERAAICDGIRGRHPEYCDQEVHLPLVRVLYGDELVRRAWPREQLLEP